jgi:AAA ATPase domain
MTTIAPDSFSRVRELALQMLRDHKRRAIPSEAPVADARALPEQSSVYTGWHEAASVLTRFDINTLRSVGGDAATDAAYLLADSLPTYGADSGTWTLHPEVRRNVLMRMSDVRLREAVAANRVPGDLVQTMIVACIDGSVPPLETLGVDHLLALRHAIEWLSESHPLPSISEVEHRLRYLRFLDPFQRLVGTHFRGRLAELARLRQYVGVLPPSSRAQSVMRRVASFFSLQSKKPLLVYGVGGVGKSTLMARFFIDHANAPEEEKFAFVYIDFDRPGVIADEPVTILIEALRQFAVEYRDAAPSLDQVRRKWQDDLRSLTLLRRERRVRDVLEDERTLRAETIEEFARILRLLGAAERPFLLVLDTFEEVQYRSAAWVSGLVGFLDSLREAVPRLRVVIAGRAAVSGVDFDDQIELQGLDQDAAEGFLEANGVAPAEIARSIARQIGGNPLSLRLAAAVIAKEGLRTDGIEKLKTQALLRRVEDSVIQAQLFQRILDHIHDERVRRVAHPGLVLRRVTPELILSVLAIPCGVDVASLAEATNLFDELAREVSLVSSANDGALVHRTDLRRVMLPPLRRDKPADVADIHRRAVAFYLEHADVVSRAEEIYHRLALHEPADDVAARWMDGVEDYLSNALDDLDPPQRAFLAFHLGLEVDRDVWWAADDRVWEAAAERRVREFMAAGNFAAARAVVVEREVRTGATLLETHEAELYEFLGQHEIAAHITNAAIQRYRAASNSAGYLRSLILSIRLAYGEGDHPKAWQAIHAAADAAKDAGDNVALLEVATLRLRTAWSGGMGGRGTLRAIDELIAAMPDAELVANAAVFTEAVRLVGRQNDDVLARAVRLTSFSSATRPQMSQLQDALRSFDPRRVARIADPLKEFLDIYPAQAIASQLLASAQESIAAILLRGDATQSLRDAVTDIIAERSLAKRRQKSAGDESLRLHYLDRRLDLSLERARELAKIVGTLYRSRAAIGEFLSQRLHRDLDTLSFADDADTISAEIVDAAERGSWTSSLVAALRHSRYRSPHVLTFADELEMAILPSSRLRGREVIPQADLRKVMAQRRDALGAVESRICRVEIRGEVVGSGFLIGEDCVATSLNIGREIALTPRPRDFVRFRFDYADVNGLPYVSGTVCRPVDGRNADEYKVRDGRLEIGCAVIPVTPNIAQAPIDPDNAERSAPFRGSVPIFRVFASKPKRLYWTWFPPRRGAHLSGVERPLVRPTRPELLIVQARSERGCEGALCLDEELRPVAIHCGTYRGRDTSVAISLAYVEATMAAEAANVSDDGDQTDFRETARLFDREELEVDETEFDE